MSSTSPTRSSTVPRVEQRGRPKNRAPRQSEIKACRPWLEQQLQIIRPDLVVCLGATAAHTVLGREFRLTERVAARRRTGLEEWPSWPRSTPLTS